MDDNGALWVLANVESESIGDHSAWSAIHWDAQNERSDEAEPIGLANSRDAATHTNRFTCGGVAWFATCEMPKDENYDYQLLLRRLPSADAEAAVLLRDANDVDMNAGLGSACNGEEAAISYVAQTPEGEALMLHRWDVHSRVSAAPGGD